MQKLNLRISKNSLSLCTQVAGNNNRNLCACVSRFLEFVLPFVFNTTNYVISIKHKMVYHKAIPQKRKPSGTMSIVEKPAWKKAKSLNLRTGGFLNMELKFLDTTHFKAFSDTILTVDPTPALCLNAVTLGSGESKRQGRRIYMETLEIDGFMRLANPVNANQMGGTSTVWVVMDTQTNEAQMEAADCISPDPDLIAGNVNSFPNLQWKERFVILGKKRFDLNANAGFSANGGDMVRSFNFKIPLKCFTTFDTSGDGGTVATITDNSLHVIAVSTDPTKHQIHYQSRLRFRDT